MKKVILSILFFLTVTVVWAQVPQQISYQSVIRDGNNVVVASSQVGIKISLLKGTATGPAVFVETHRKTTNANGLVSLEIGTGTVLSGRFSSIDWANGPYLIQTETDPTGGTNYSIPAVIALNSVPYALFAANGTPGPKGDKGDPGAIGDKGDRGATGLTGPQGPIGLTGPAGAVGDKGDTGASGPTGVAGLTGPQGIQGLTGATGSQGPVGLTGPAGPTGVTGLTGATGPQGPIGLTGPAGPQGLSGNVGAAGSIGPQGPIGLTGPAGAQGPIGLTGSAGPQGAPGSTGAAGAQGIQGPTGATGAAGPAPAGTGIVTVNNGSLQTPGALTGDVTTTLGGLTTTIGAAKVTNSMLAGSIDLTSKVTGTLPVANGGTGLNTTPSNGQLDIGNGSGFTRATLTAGTGISITNASGAITIASSGGSSGVPYTGATGAVNLGGYDLTVNGLTIGTGKVNGLSTHNTIVGGSGVNRTFTSAVSNTAIGYNTISSATPGSNNTAVGAWSLVDNNNGTKNSAMGVGALQRNLGGNENTAIGYYALWGNTSGSNNTAIGNAADMVDGLNNSTAIGSGATVAASNTIQLGNTSVTDVNTSGSVTANGVKIGRGAGNVSTNTAVGRDALKTNTTGASNTALGTSALEKNSTAGYNVGIGFEALKNTTTGGNNTAVGRGAMLNNTTGDVNTAVGEFALVSNTTGRYNTSIGHESQYQNTAGNSNTAIGAAAIDRMTSGSNNVVLGGFAGRYFGTGISNNNTTLNSSIIIGYDTRPKLNNGSNEIVIGTSAIGNGSNTTTIGGASNTDTYLNGNVHVSNALKISGGTPGVGKVLTSDANGLASWTTPASGGVPFSGATGGVNLNNQSLVNVNIAAVGTATPNASAKLDISSTTQGFLPPRMTYEQRQAIASPATGLVVFCTNCGPASVGGELEVYSGGMWRNMTGTAAATPALVNIGDSYLGGKVAYILQSGDPGYDPSVQHGLIAAISDHPVRIQWWNGSYITTGATATAIGTGFANTNTIITAQGSGSYAASVARNHTGGGYTDWYLPSKVELEKLWINKNAIGGFVGDWYYSSSENPGTSPATAWLIGNSSGTWWPNVKHEAWSVRAVRAF